MAFLSETQTLGNCPRNQYITFTEWREEEKENEKESSQLNVLPVSLAVLCTYFRI